MYTNMQRHLADSRCHVGTEVMANGFAIFNVFTRLTKAVRDHFIDIQYGFPIVCRCSHMMRQPEPFFHVYSFMFSFQT